MIEWQSVVLEEALQHLFDHRGRTPKKLGADFTSSGVQVISAKLVSGGRLNLRRERRFVSAEVYNRWMPVKLAEGDVLLTSEAPLGEAALVPANSTLCLGQRLFALRPDPEVLDPRFLYYWLRSAAGRSALGERSSGTTVFGIRQSELVQVEVPAPTIHLQRLIGALLAAIDDLIENDQRRIELLEQMAQTIYREWFVHFRYPGYEDATFVDSPLGLIPEGWTVTRIGEVLELRYGKALRAADRRGGRVAVVGSSEVVGWHDQEIMSGPAIVVGRKGNVGNVVFVPGPCWPIDTTYYVATDLPLRYVAEQLKRAEFINSHAAVPGLSRQQAYSLPFLLPAPEVMSAFAEASTLLGLQAQSLDRQIDQLAGIRDLLLPKLVTGQIDVSELDLDALTESVA